MTITATLGALDAMSGVLVLQQGQSATWSVSGTFVGRIVIEEGSTPAAFGRALRVYGTDAGVIDGPVFFRMRMDRYTSGTASVEMGLNVEEVPGGGGVVVDAGPAADMAVLRNITALTPLATATCRLLRVSATEARLYRPLGLDGYWLEMLLRDGGVSGGPLCWNQSALTRVMRFTTAADAACVYTGTWSNLGSANPAAYTGGLGKQADNGNSSEYVDITFEGGGDLYVFYTGRTNGSYFRVDLNGSTDNATELPTNGTYRYIDTYTTTDLFHKQSVLVARDLPAGSHTIRLTSTADRNPANTTGFRAIFEALAILGDSVLPGQTGTDATAWQASTAVAQWKQVRAPNGNYYAASVAGTTSASPPTHTTGTAVDGTVTWTYMSRSSYATGFQRFQVSGSELEYACTQYQPTGATAYEDFGGIAHGNEAQTACWVDADGTITQWSAVADGTWISGASVALKQTVTTSHSELPGVKCVTTQRSVRVSATHTEVDHDHTWHVPAAVGGFYTAMWPLLHWSMAEFRYGITHVWTPRTGLYASTDYYGQANPIIGNEPDYIMAGAGNVLMPEGSGGVPSAGPAQYQLIVAMSATPESVGYYANGNVVKAGKAMNPGATTAPGLSSVVNKFYFESASTTNPRDVVAGERWNCSARYDVILTELGAEIPYL